MRLCHQKRQRIRANAIEGRVRHGNKACIANNEVEADGQDAVDAEEYEKIYKVIHLFFRLP